jgi:hypothetical protein
MAEMTNMGMQTPFYCLWGDLAAAAALQKSYQEKGFEVSIEDLIDYPTIEGQIRLLRLKQISK